MLQSIRNRAQGVLAWVILLMICIPFAFWGIQNYFGTGQEQPVVVVGDKEFFQRDVVRAYQQLAARFGSMGQVDEKILKDLAIKNLVDEEVLSQAVVKQGYTISDSQIRSAIQEVPYFQTDGKFDNVKFSNVLKAQQVSESGLVAQLRRSLEIGQFSDGVTRTSFVTPSEVDRFLRLRDQERSAEYIVVPVGTISESVSDDLIDKYYNEHIELFQNPEKVAINFIELSVDDIAKTIEVTEEELLSSYEGQKDLYTKPARRRLSHILVAASKDVADKSEAAALNKINQAKTRIDDGEDFALVAQEMSDDAISGKQGGDLGVINLSDMDAAFEKAARGLKLGEVSKPVKTPFGYHLIKLMELEAGEIKSFEEVRGEVEKAYRHQAAENGFYETGERLAQVSYENPDSLEPAAESTALTIKQSGLFSREQGDGIAASQSIRSAAFSDDVLGGKNSEAVEVSADKIVVLRVNQRIPATNKSLADVKQEIIDLLHMEISKEKAKTLANALFEKVKEGQDLARLASTYEIESQGPKSITRGDSEVPVQFKDVLFKTEKPAPGETVPLLVSLDDGQHIVGRLLAVKDSDPRAGKDYQKEKELAASWLAGQYGNAEFGALLAQLRDNTEIVIRESEE